MSLQALLNITSQWGQLFHIDTNSLSVSLIVLGLSILILALVVGGTYAVVKAAREIPNMPFKQFVFLVLAVAAFMVVLGVLLP
jgi:flagellar biosynthesis protein FliQ